MSTDERRPESFDTIGEIDDAALQAAILETALELDVFTVIGPRTMSLEATARAVGADPRALAVLLDALCSLGLLDKSPAGYTLEAAAAAFLVRGGEAFWGDVALRESAVRRQLTAVVRSGRAAADLVAPSGSEIWAGYVSPRLATWADDVDEELAMWHELGVRVDTLPCFRVLDVACGSGIRTFCLAHEYPEVRIVAVDTAPVLEIARRLAARMGISDHVEFRPGDVTSIDLGSGEFDAALLSSLLYFFTPELARELLSRVWRSLRPGGLVVVRTAIADEERRAAKEALLTAVELLLWLPTSHVYTFAEYEDLLRRAGFVEIARSAEDRVTAVRPSRAATDSERLGACQT